MEVYHEIEPEKLGSRIIRHYKENKLQGMLNAITVEQMQNGKALVEAQVVYNMAVKMGDDTIANEANTFINMLKDRS